ncbi:MAG: hypothetical protein HC876_18040 [Chloroflexaceae bacterium]|nr:hypothetical protein [Chloroflexaceae bacterium]
MHKRTHKLQHWWRTHTRGQSIPLLALMIVVLIGMVGLSVDVGNTYQEQRQLVRATNAAAVTGMETYLEEKNDQAVADAIRQSFQGNGITPVPFGQTSLAANERQMRARYYNYQGTEIASCSEVGSCGEALTNDVAYIRVETQGTVDTYFARVLGRDTLPVNTQGCAGTCAPVQGVYPLGVRVSAIDLAEDELRPDPVLGNSGEVYFSETEQYVRWRRFYIGNPVADSDIGMLRWREEYNRTVIGVMMGTPGNLEQGFEEASWSGEPGREGEYPIEPARLSPGDWAYGFNEGAVINQWGALVPILEAHRDNRTRMILPIYSYATGNADGDGGRPAFYIQQFGVFYVRDVGQDADGYFIELAYLRAANNIACPCSDAGHPRNLRRQGEIDVRAQWTTSTERTEGEIRPAAYAVVLDVSGSMSWNIDGLGTWTYDGGNGRDYQCETYNPSINLPFAGDVGLTCSGGKRAPWKESGERRITWARESIIDLVYGMIPDDRIRIITFSSDLKESMNQWVSGGADVDPAVLNQVRTIGQCCTDLEGNPSYLTDGGTAGADGLWQAYQFLTSSDFPDTINGKKVRPVVIYMSDGVSNQMFLSTQESDGRPECADIPRPTMRNTAFCHLGYTNDGRELPIQSMIRVSQEMHDDIDDEDFALFVLAMGKFDTRGLDQVATSPSYLFEARDVESIANLLKRIENEVKYPPECKENIDIFEGDSGNLISGKVTIKNGGTTVQVADIDPRTGTFSFRTADGTGLPPGTYTITAWATYRGPDNVGRTYEWFLDVPSDGGTDSETNVGTYDTVRSKTFTISAGQTLGGTINIGRFVLGFAKDTKLCP